MKKDFNKISMIEIADIIIDNKLITLNIHSVTKGMIKPLRKISDFDCVTKFTSSWLGSDSYVHDIELNNASIDEAIKFLEELKISL